jgi:hypothetical protein
MENIVFQKHKNQTLIVKVLILIGMILLNLKIGVNQNCRRLMKKVGISWK